MSANGQVIKAAQMFVKQGAGASKSFNLKAELVYGTTLGIGIGLTWKVHCGTFLIVCFLKSQSFCAALLIASLVRRQDYCLQVYHWNEKRKQAEYYTTLARLEKDKE